MRRFLILSTLLAAAAAEQWVHYPTAGLPRNNRGAEQTQCTYQPVDGTELLDYYCAENEKDGPHLVAK